MVFILMKKTIILGIAFFAVAAFAITLLSSGVLASSPTNAYFDGPCTDTCIQVMDLNSNGICEPGIDKYTTIAAAPIHPDSLPQCP